MDVLRLALAVALTVTGSAAAYAQAPASLGAPIVLVDSTGRAAGRPLNETLVLVAVGGVTAPAAIRPVYGPDEKTASGSATWQSGGSVLFTSPDCSTGAHVFSSGRAGLRATTQVETPDGVVLYVGAIATPVTVSVRSILYGSGCSPVTVQQNGVVPVEATLNLTTTYRPPLSFQ
jgi:hypothetical protein